MFFRSFFRIDLPTFGIEAPSRNSCDFRDWWLGNVTLQHRTQQLAHHCFVQVAIVKTVCGPTLPCSNQGLCCRGMWQGSSRARFVQAAGASAICGTCAQVLACMHTYKHTHTHTHTLVCIDLYSMCVCVCACMYVCTYVMSCYVYCMYVCMYVRRQVCLYVFIHT